MDNNATTIAQALRYGQQILSPLYGKQEAKALSRLALQHILQYNSSTQLLLNAHTKLTSTQTDDINNCWQLLLNNKPLQYITQSTSFCGLTIRCTPAALIPRPETEELVHDVVAHNRLLSLPLPQPDNALAPPPTRQLRILDIGTGTGCIALAIKKNIPDAEVWALDISNEALVLAQQNARQLGLNIWFLQADILNLADPQYPIPDNIQDAISNKFDVIVSNPPYIAEKEKATMLPNVLDYEPHTALFVPDSDPLLFYRAICKFAQHYLNCKGHVFLEINEHYAHEILQLLSAENAKNIEVKKDINEKYRIVRASFN